MLKREASGDRRFFITASVAFAVPSWASEERGSIRLLVAFGGGAESIVRVLSPKLSEALGQQVVVEPMPDAAGMIAARTVARAKPDGLTLLVGSGNAMIFRPLVMRNPPYDAVKDFTPISQFTSGAFTLAIDPNLSIKNFHDFIEYAKRTQGGARIGVGGNPSINDLNRAMLEQSVPGLKMVSIPYKAESQAIVDTMGGHITGVIAATSQIAGSAKEGKLRALVTFADERREPLDDVPAVTEVVPGFKSFRPFTGFWGPANLPKPTVDRLHAAIAKALQDKEFAARTRVMGSIAQSSTPEQLHAATIAEIARTRDTLRKLSFTPE